MTEKTVEALELLFKTIEQSQGEMLKRALLTMLNDVMDTEASASCGAEYRARDEERVNRRNGYRERTLQTRMGELELAIPKLRSGSCMPSFLEPRKRWERAFVNVVCEAYVHGVCNLLHCRCPVQSRRLRVFAGSPRRVRRSNCDRRASLSVGDQ